MEHARDGGRAVEWRRSSKSVLTSWPLLLQTVKRGWGPVVLQLWPGRRPCVQRRKHDSRGQFVLEIISYHARILGTQILMLGFF